MQMISMKNIHFSFDCVEMVMRRAQLPTVQIECSHLIITGVNYFRKNFCLTCFLIKIIITCRNDYIMCACSGSTFDSKPDTANMLIKRKNKKQNHMHDKTKIDWLRKSILEINSAESEIIKIALRFAESRKFKSN